MLALQDFGASSRRNLVKFLLVRDEVDLRGLLILLKLGEGGRSGRIQELRDLNLVRARVRVEHLPTNVEVLVLVALGGRRHLHLVAGGVGGRSFHPCLHIRI